MKKVEAQEDLAVTARRPGAEDAFVHLAEVLKEIAQQNEAVQKEGQDLIDQEDIEDVNSIQV